MSQQNTDQLHDTAKDVVSKEQHAYYHEHHIEHTHDNGIAPHHHHDHGHTHDPKEMKAIINRLARSIGHLEACKRMLEEERDCTDVLIQLAAVRSEINNASKLLLKEHMDHCIIEAATENDMDSIAKLETAIDMFIK